MENKPTERERTFTVELKSKANLKNVTLNNGSHENALIEGTIGRLNKAEFAEDMLLEVLGEKGVLRIDLTPDEILSKRKETEV